MNTQWFKAHRGATAGIVGGVVVLVLLIIYIVHRVNISSEGASRESDLSTQYNKGAITLSQCVQTVNKMANVASANADAFDKVIKDAVAGNGAFHTNASKSVGGLVPILVQSYPDLAGQTELYNKVANQIVQCEGDFRSAQTFVQDNVRTFNSWRNNGWNQMFGSGNFPDENLYVDIPGAGPRLHGQDALDKIEQPIVDTVTSKSYGTGIRDDSSVPFPSASPSK